MVFWLVIGSVIVWTVTFTFAPSGVQLVAFFLETLSKAICAPAESFGLVYHDGQKSVCPLTFSDWIPAGLLNQSLVLYWPSGSSTSLWARPIKSLITAPGA